MNRVVAIVALALLACAGRSLADGPERKEQPRADRGREAVHGQPPLNPPVWAPAAYENAWRAWGLKEKPSNYDTTYRERYGLHAPPYENGGLPMGIHVAPGRFGKGLAGDCLLCHAGSVAGKTYIGLGNASLDMQSLFEEMPAFGTAPLPPPIRLTNVRGTVEATAVVTFLMEFRNPDLSLRLPKNLNVKGNLCEDVPAWWHLKRKKTMYHTGSGHARSVRTMMPFLLSPFNSANDIKKLEPIFADIQDFLLTLEPPKYPFPIDRGLAARGGAIFSENCAKCHGTYGPEGKYPSKVVPLDVIGTDRSLAEYTKPEFVKHYAASWFAQEKDPYGKPFPLQTIRGYQAPPLEGVWATAPYFHNGSVPTVYHVLNSQARPKVFTRSFGTEKEDYDIDNLGLKVTLLNHHLDTNTPARERRKIYDTTQPGRGNSGHTFGDALTDPERRAIIEYLKTL